jgi:peptidoglycan/LPS O-acetylase OafA/YrhL
MRHFGLLSYSLYLFHVPVMRLLHPLGLSGSPLFAAMLTCTYGAAVVSYLLIEKPFLLMKPKRVSTDQRFAKVTPP